MKKLLALLMAATMTVALAACGAPQGATPKDPQEDDSGKKYTIGIAQSMQHAALDAATKGFQDALVDKLGADKLIFEVKNASGESANNAVICTKFVEDGVDLILANGSASLQAAAAATNKIPILGTSVTDYATALENPDIQDTTGTNISGTSDLAPLDQQAAMLHDLFPDAKNVGILFCSAEPNSKFQSSVMTGHLEKLGYTVKEFTFSDTNDVSSVTQTACDASDVLYIPTDNTAASCTEAINNVALPAGIPIIAGEQGLCEGCGVATLSINYYDLGYTTGEMAYRILVDGADVSTMQIEYCPAGNLANLYNPKICEALQITPPEGYEAIPAK